MALILVVLFSLVALLTLGAHAPQGYSSWVCVCVSGLIFPNSSKSAKKNYGSPQHFSRLIYKVFFL